MVVPSAFFVGYRPEQVRTSESDMQSAARAIGYVVKHDLLPRNGFVRNEKISASSH
jgi:hypothetical protein